MNQTDTAHAWWSRLRHQGLLLSPVVMVERYPTAPPEAPFPALPKLRDARIRFESHLDAGKQSADFDQAAILGFTDALLEGFIGHTGGRLAKQGSIPEKLTAPIRIGSRLETIRPHRVLFADEARTTPAVLVMADTSPQVGRGRGRTAYSRFLELLRGTGHRLGLLTNGQQFRLVYAGLDFEASVEWESNRWFDEGEGTEELCGLRQLLLPAAIPSVTPGIAGLLDAVEESRKRQADLSSVLRENVRQAVELLLEEVSTAHRTKPDLFASLMTQGDDRKLSDAETHEAMFQATVRVVMRLVVCLFAESRQLLPINDPIYAQSYGVRSLYELLEEVTRYEGGTHALFNRQTAWHRLMALFRLIYGGSSHGAFPMRPYGGVLFRPGDDNSSDAVARALHVLEHSISVGDATIYHVLRKLLRGPLPVIKGKSKTFVDGPVDYTDLRTEFIGLIYEGLLDYRLKRTDEQIGPQIFLNLGREPVLPLARLEDMLANDKKGLKDLLTTLRKEKVTATAAEEEDEVEEETDEVEKETSAEIEVEADEAAVAVPRTGDYLDSVEAAKRWAREAVVLAGLIGKQKAREPDSAYQVRMEAEANKLVKRVVAVGEFYLVRAGNTRKGTGTFYTRPQLAVPTVHRTLEPLCYAVDSGRWIVDGGKQETNDECARLSTTGRVAEGDGPGDAGVSIHQDVSKGGNLRPDQSSTASGGVGAVEHRRGSGTPDDEGVSQLPVDGEGVAPGSSDSNRDRPSLELPRQRDSRGDRSTPHDRGSTAQRLDERPGPQVGQRKKLTPRKPEEILSLKVCDPACGSASFLVAALHYLTDALYASLCYHCRIEDPEQSKLITLPYGHARSSPSTIHRPPSTELVPFPPNDPQRGDTFTERIKALLRRHIVERCIYGVDINPLAVELARVSLWVETLDPELPFSFLDHKIKVGNALVGCWLDRVLDYPLAAWEREGGDGKNGVRTKRIKSYLTPVKVDGGQWMVNGVLFPSTIHRPPSTIKQEMRQVIESRFQNQPSLFADRQTTPDSVVAQERSEYEKLHDLPIADPDEQERYYREQVERSPSLAALKRAMDEWCAVWFWPTDEASLQRVPTPQSFHHEIHEIHEKRYEIVRRVAKELKFFHWELEFPDVFSPERQKKLDPASSHSPLSCLPCLSWSGFDAVLGNPPWEVMKPISQEFFTEYDPLYRTYDKQTALLRQKQIFATVLGAKDRWDEYNASFKSWSNWVKNAAEPFALSLARGKQEAELASAWSRVRAERVGYAAMEKPFTFQGSADLNSYKLFLEVAHHLLQAGGRLGFIVPSGLYTDAGCHDLRELFLNRSTWAWLFGFENRKRIFDIDGRFKFAAVIVGRYHMEQAINATFMVQNLSEWESQTPPIFPLPKKNILEFSPKTLSILEITNQRDLDICRKIYANSFRIGDKTPGWEIRYAREFDMTNDSKHFSPREKWEANGYKPDVFGRWVGPDGDVVLPLYEGRMIGQFDFSQKGYVRGRGRSAVWRELPFDDKTIEPQYLMADSTYRSVDEISHGMKLSFMDIASSTNARTMIAATLHDLPFGNSAPVLAVDGGNVEKTLALVATFNSLPFDFATRQRVGGLHLNWFIVEECVSPKLDPASRCFTFLTLHAAYLTFLHRRFAPEWLRLKHLFPELAAKEWKHWWAVTEADRLRLRIEIDALAADLYGLDPDDFDWIVRDDPTDPKGFYRVDRHLPFRERLTGLAAAAFRALKEGKWQPLPDGRGSEMTNDEFFALLGIPEMTTGPEPLIRKRTGCHVWKPEEFGKDDPRYGWTWEDCWKDAVALLGSEEAVRRYIEGEETTKDTKGTKNKEDKKDKRDKRDKSGGQRGLFAGEE